jgi:hypothetical protein
MKNLKIIILIIFNLFITNGFGQVDIENDIISSLIKSKIASKAKDTIFNKRGEIRKIKSHKIPLILLVYETETNPFSSINDSIDKLMDKKWGLAHFDSTCYADFKRKNSSKIHIDSILGFQGTIKYISIKDKQNNFEEVDWSENKNNEFLLVTVSRPGLNSKNNKAFIYYSESFYGISGAGYYFILENVNDKWIIKGSMLIWMS